MTRRIILVDIGSGLTLTGVLPSVLLYDDYAATLSTRGGQAPYVYTVSAGALPDGLALDRATGQITGTTSAAGSFAFTVRVTDLSGAFVDRPCVITVTAEPLTLAGNAPNGTIGTAYAYSYTPAGGVPPRSFSIVAGALPDGVVLNAGTGALSGTPTVGGSFAWTVRVEDSIGGSFDLDDSANVAYATLTLSGTYAAATVGTPYSSDLTISGGNGTYSNPHVTVGTLPTWATLSIVSGKLRLSGTPTGSATTVGLTVAVDSGDGQTATSAQSFAVSTAVVHGWNPSDKNASITLTNGDLRATDSTTTSVWKCVRGVVGKSSGKWYFEVFANNAGSGLSGLHAAGVATAGASLSSYPGSDASGWAYLGDGYKAHSGYSAYGSTWSTTGMRLAVDLDTGLVWFGGGPGWNGDPATGASPAFTGVSGTVYPIAGMKSGDWVELRKPTDYLWTPPAGFAPWV